MASKALKHNQSDLHLSDESMQQTPNVLTGTRVGGRVYSGVVPNQVTNSQHDELAQQNNTRITNETNNIRKFQSNNEPSRQPSSMSSNSRKPKKSKFHLLDEPIQQPPSMADKTPIYEQRNFSLSSEPSRQPPTKSNTVCDRQVSHGVMDNQQIPDQIEHVNDLELNDEIGRWSNSQHEQPRQQGTHEISNGSNEVENAESRDEEIEQKVRGPTYMLKIWGRPSSLPLIYVDFDRYGRPIGANKSTFTEFLGTIARNGKYCPIDVENWHKMSKENKSDMIKIVKEKFDITHGDEEWILHSINDKWRSWKAFVKARCFIPNIPVELLIDDKEGRVSEDQWVNLVNYWKREDVEAQSQQKKDARSKKKLDQRTGKNSFAEIHEKFRKKKGRAPFHSEMFEVCYTPANESPSIEVAKYLESMKELTNQLPEGSNDFVGPKDIFAQVTGLDKPGYVRMFGGVPASDVWGEVPGRNSYKRKVLEQQLEISELKNQMAELKSQQQRFISQEPQGSTSPESLPRLVLKKQTFRVGGSVNLKSVLDPTKIVAKGCLHSTDPNAQVGGQALGENWCQVHVKVVLQPEEQLIRPYDFFRTLEDVYGGMVAWPCSLVTSAESRSKV